MVLFNYMAKLCVVSCLLSESIATFLTMPSSGELALTHTLPLPSSATPLHIRLPLAMPHHHKDKPLVRYSSAGTGSGTGIGTVKVPIRHRPAASIHNVVYYRPQLVQYGKIKQPYKYHMGYYGGSMITMAGGDQVVGKLGGYGLYGLGGSSHLPAHYHYGTPYHHSSNILNSFSPVKYTGGLHHLTLPTAGPLQHESNVTPVFYHQESHQGLHFPLKYYKYKPYKGHYKDNDVKPIVEHIEDDIVYDFRTKTHSYP